MTRYVLSINPGGIELYPHNIHQPSAALFRGGKLVYGVEEERFSRQKHGHGEFPEESIRACLDHCSLELGDVEKVVVPWDMDLQSRRFEADVNRRVSVAESPLERYIRLEQTFRQQIASQFFETEVVEDRLAEIDEPVPPVETRSHHRCHAASAFHPSGFEEALVLTLDAFGEYDSTVVWHGDDSGVERVRTYEFPNSLGVLYGMVTVFLGYSRESESEGKVMGLAPYGGPNEEIRSAFESAVETGVDHDVTALTHERPPRGVRLLEDLFDRERKESPTDFTNWEKDLAYETQRLLEETVVDVVETYVDELGVSNVAIAGGVGLNCKMNKRVMESPLVEEVFVQPVAHDGGLTVGGGMLEWDPAAVPELRTVYLGPSYDEAAVTEVLERTKVEWFRPDALERYVAERIADGALVGWFRGRTEMGPRALGNRSILADPRTAASRDRVNRFVKHRETWRPFAPSMLEERADEYLENYAEAPFMTKTFDVPESRQSEIEAVLHPGDATTRPQTVTAEQNPVYHRLLSAFEEITGTPVVLNTSFNVSGEPIVNTPEEALRDFYSTGMDLLVLEDVVVEK